MFETKARSIIYSMIVATLQKIYVNSGKCRYNFRCQMNAVNDAIEADEERIAMVFYVQERWPSIHFLNVDSFGNFTDNTIGHWSTTYDYYLVRYIEKKSFYDVQDIFTAYREELHNRLPWYIRLFHGKTNF